MSSLIISIKPELRKLIRLLVCLSTVGAAQDVWGWEAPCSVLLCHRLTKRRFALY